MVPSAIVLMEELPLTPNGKIDRKALPEVEATRPEMRQEYVGAKTEIEEILCGIWERVLGVERVGIHDNFFDLGGDSILSIQLINRVRQAGIFLTPRQLFQHQTVAQLAAVATAQRPHQTAESDQSEQLPVIGSLLLTPVQRWFFEHDLPNPHHWNQAILLQARQPLDHSLLERALQELISHHDALRLRFTRQGSDWQQFSADTSEQVSCRALDLSALPVEEQRRVIEAEATALQSSLDISQGPLYRAAYFYSGDEHPDRLLLVIHHLAVDAVSWRILLEDLETAYRQLSLGEAVRLPPKTISFKQWAERLAEYARSPELEREAAYWLSDREEKSSRLPVDLDGGPNTEASTQTVSVSLNEEETHSLLHEVPAAYLARINEVLLSALAQTLSRWAGGALPVDIEGHGREEVFEGRDTSRTVGWFTSIFPVMLEAVSEEEASANASLKRVKEQLRRIPQKGIGYGVLRYLRGDASLREQLRSRPHPEVSFNYLGQLDQVFSRSRLFKQTTQEIGPTHDPQGRRRYLLEINGSVINGQLQLNWTYSENLHRRDTIEKLALEFTAALKSLIATCASGEADCHTPSDFPLARLDQLTLDQLVQEYGQLENIYPLSPIQRGMLFHSLYAPASGVYVEQLSLTLRGNLDIAAFERAWQQAAQRHATLRTAFVWENLDEPLQLVQRKVGLSWEREDWREFSTDEQQDRLAAYLRTDRSRGFELSEAPLMRMWLSRLTDETYQLVWSYHHLLLDGWSLPIILEEVLSFYETSRQDRELRLDSGQPYLDYINWLRQQDLSEAEAFWRKSLEGFHTPTPIGVDSVARSSTAMEGDHAEQQTRLTLSKTAQLQSFARQHQLTLNTLLQGAWALLLSRYSGERDVVFGATVSGRSAELTGAERMVGPFINTVPVRVRTPARARTLNWLRELQGQQAELRNYEYTPLVQIQGWSEVPRSRPLFESIFVFENYPVDASLRDLQGSLRIDKIDFFEQTNYPLAVMAVPGPELLLKVMYDRQRFDDATVSRMLSHFENLLTGIRANPDQPISQLPLLSAHELTRLLTEWNDTQVEYERDKCIHELIEAQAASTPEAVALVFEKEKLSYRELNERANQLAHHLRQQGVGPESLVGVLMERSVEQVVALLGVLKAGGAYVPLDPAYPRERLAYMLADARVEVLLTQEGLAGVLPPTPARAIYLDTAWRQIAKASTENPAGVVTADNLAYIIYTSGSTGRPKGVMVPHRALGNHMAWMAGRFPLGAADRVLQKTPFSFDASVWEFYAPLLAGAQLVLAEPGGHADPAYLVKLIAEQEVTTLQLVPTLLERLLEEAGMAECVSLKRVFCGGEALSVRVAERFREKLGAEFYNLYGPTEATIDATYWKYEAGVAGSSIPIGRPVANTQIYLLDRYVHPVPEGVPGELHIGGVQLARGYHGRPELTAEKFIPDPFGGVAGGRLYKTGDLGRYLPNGELEFLGRIDHQVKVRGFRIELGEVEARLVEQPGVREAVVVAREDAGGEQRLVGYVACAKGETPSQSELRKRLREKLPEYMVPSAIVLMEELPLTPNGKIDRKALPAPEGLRPELTEDLVLPRTPLEGVLASIWRDVLGLEEVGVHDNFFELGGHSLLAMQLLSRLRRVLKVDLPLRDLMSTATIAEVARLLTAREAALGQVERLDYLAESLDEAGAGHLRAGVIPPRQADEELPLSFAQQRLWFLSQLQPEVALYNCPAAVRLKGRLNAEALVRALSEIIRRHEILRTNFPATENGNPVQRILQARPLIPQVVDLRTFPTSEREDEARRLLVEEARKPFDLTQDQLLRVTLLNLDQEDSVLMLTAHHINVDAWSMGVLVGELATLYQAFSTNNPSPLPELPIQYADFALWQRQWLQGEVLAEQSRYWKRVLGGQLPVLELPVGRPRARQRTHHGERRIFLIDQELAAALNSLSRLEGVTLYMTLLAAFQTLLHRYTKQDDIIVGTAIANRPLDELEGLIGCFINTLALRTDFSGGPGFQEVLRQVRELSLGALSHQDMPFDKLVDELQPERSLSETPIVQVAFGIQNSPMPALELTGLKLTPIEVDDGIARLDLTLWIEESAGGLKAAWTYSTDLFDAQAIKRMHRHYETLLRSIVAHPETRVDALDMLTEAEKEQVEAQGKRREESNYQRLLKVRPKSVSTPQEIVKD
jgi:amino acid adenylation domain-containing protein/non-ribosomal peptide synthase protein (TIGR01720 family)